MQISLKLSYIKAEKIGEQDIFIEMWSDFKYSCENLDIDIDDVFRYYTHIIRGKEGITSSEINLRKFFTQKEYSPFRNKKYKEIMDELFKIVEALDFFEKMKYQNKYFQLIDIYSNQYPKIVMIVYLFLNDLNFNERFIISLVAYIYYQGSTTKIKFEIYNMIKNISKNYDDYIEYVYDLDISYFEKIGSLKYGYTLLAYYIDHDIIPNYTIDKIVSPKDKRTMKTQFMWSDEQLDELSNSLGNFIVLDTTKKNQPILKKLEYYKYNSATFDKSIDRLDYDAIKQRDIKLKQKLVRFFRGER